jgi:hypothetical protein
MAVMRFMGKINGRFAAVVLGVLLPFAVLAQETVSSDFLETINQACLKVKEAAQSMPSWGRQINEALDKQGRVEEADTSYLLTEFTADKHRWMWQTDSLGNKLDKGKDLGVDKAHSNGLYALFLPENRARFQFTRTSGTEPGQILITCKPLNKKEKAGFTGTYLTDSTGMPLRIEGSLNTPPPMTIESRNLMEYSREAEGLTRLQRLEIWGKVKILLLKKSFHSVTTYFPYPQK